MTDFGTIPGPEWIGRFLTTLVATGIVGQAIEATGRAPNTIYRQRNRNAAFAAAWRTCMARRRAKLSTVAEADDPAAQATGRGRRHFLETLAETSNVTASARRANMPLAEVYKLRRADTRFAAAWRTALVEGYDMLEMELLGHLRDPKSQRKLDVAVAMRLLAAHRDTVARQRALSEDDDEEEVLASIDRFIEDMRSRREANAALVIEHRPTAERNAGDGGNDHAGGGDAAG